MSIQSLCETLCRLPKLENTRHLVAVAGAPGSGKSTLAEVLAAALDTAGTMACVMPMDGFHLDNVILEQRGLFARKGAPETFDAAGFARMIDALKMREDVVIPTFDRARDIAIAGARVIPAETDVIIVEGNYLLFDDANWRGLTDHWSVAIRLDVPLEILRSRLIQRWLDHGLSAEQAVIRAQSNDLANAQRVIDQALMADVTVRAADLGALS